MHDGDGATAKNFSRNVQEAEVECIGVLSERVYPKADVYRTA